MSKNFYCTIIIAVFMISASATAFAVTDMPFPALGMTLPAVADDSFTFAVFGDFRSARRDIPYPESFVGIMEDLRIIAPSFAVNVGDSYYGYGGSLQRFRNEVARYVSGAKALGVPVFTIIGNHDVTGNAERENCVTDMFGKLYGSFDHGSSHFIALNTEEMGRAGTITGAQLEWLKNDLAANRDAKNIFVFLHRPLFSVTDPDLSRGAAFKNKLNRDALHELFAANKVKIVFAGHEHLFDDRTLDGVRYLIAGGGGAPLVRDAGHGGFFHYMIVRVNKDSADVGAIAPKALRVRVLSGNDGFEARTEIEVVNISHIALPADAIPFLMPTDRPERYRVSATGTANSGVRSALPARIMKVKDNGDGTMTVFVGTRVEANGYLRITVDSAIDQ